MFVVYVSQQWMNRGDFSLMCLKCSECSWTAENCHNEIRVCWRGSMHAACWVPTSCPTPRIVARQASLSMKFPVIWARILEWVAIPFSRGSSWPRNWTWVSCISRWVLYHCATWNAQSAPCLVVIHMKEASLPPQIMQEQQGRMSLWDPAAWYWYKVPGRCLDTKAESWTLDLLGGDYISLELKIFWHCWLNNCLVLKHVFL